MAKSFIQKEEYYYAKIHLDEVLKPGSTTILAYYYRGFANFMTQNYLEAKRDFINFILADKNNKHELAEAWTKLGIMFARGESVAGLPQEFISSINIPNEAAAHLYVAKYCFDTSLKLTIANTNILNNFSKVVEKKIEQSELQSSAKGKRKLADYFEPKINSKPTSMTVPQFFQTILKPETGEEPGVNKRARKAKTTVSM